ncbi:MAG: prolipoprotein diacylglyceryl transferase [Simkaniaceae bacterium]|nr:prolipoprotein diacylglyceryl transferase [Simkaniaceae bacterium]
MMGYVTWDPIREAFWIPIINHPVAWYGILFALGFLLGYYVFIFMMRCYLLTKPYTNSPEFNHRIDSESCDFDSRFLRFAKNRLDPESYRKIQMRLMLERENPKILTPLKERARQFVDQITLYVVVGTLVGSRLGDIIFYENVWTYLVQPWRIFMTWEGGLSSHGGVVGIFIALALFKYRIRNTYSSFTWVKLVDYMAVPTALAAIFIRLGNFVNQEILGTQSNLPWAVIFKSPIDGLPVVPRHPVQIYEALFYLLVFLCLMHIFYYHFTKLKAGLLGGLFFILVFGFRFLIEFIKEKQSVLIATEFPLTMGQLLSIPCILFGLYLFFWHGRERKQGEGKVP